MGHVDLNADLGEEVTDDAALLEVVTSANVACGYHAGNAAIMRSCLLYTSPSPRDRTRSRMPSSA